MATREQIDSPIDELIRRTVTAAPPLTSEQEAELRPILSAAYREIVDQRESAEPLAAPAKAA